MKDKCKHDGGYLAVGQNTVSLGNGVVVISSSVCAKCGDDFKVKATQIPFIMPKEDKKVDIMLPKRSLIK